MSFTEINMKKLRRLNKYFYRERLCFKFIQLSTNNKNDIFAFEQMIYHCEKARDKLRKFKQKSIN